MGSVIGKGGSKIKEIQEASGARLQASEAMLPGSTERVLSVSGVADAIHIAVYYIGTILQEGAQQAGGVVNQSYRPGQGAPGGAPAGYGQDPYGAPRGAQPGYGQQQQPRGPPPPGPGAQTQQIYIPNELVGESKNRGQGRERAEADLATGWMGWLRLDHRQGRAEDQRGSPGVPVPDQDFRAGRRPSTRCEPVRARKSALT